MKAHRKKSEYLVLDVPEKRGRKRKLQDEAQRKMVKRALKKRKASPAKVAKQLSKSPKFKGTISRGTIYNHMQLKGKRKSKRNLLNFDECCF